MNNLHNRAYSENFRQQFRNKLWSGSLSINERQTAWPLLCASKSEIERRVNLFHSLDGETSGCEKHIAKDIGRTFTLFMKHPGCIADSMKEEKLRESHLFRVLKAYSLYNRQVGYRQGMNFIAGVIILQLGDPALSFAVLLTFLDEKMDVLFDPKKPFLKKYVDKFNLIVRRHIPRVHQHLAKENLDLTYVCLEWFTTVFSCSLNLPSVLWLFDMLLAGMPELMFRAGLAVLTTLENQILRLNFTELMIHIKEFLFEIPHRKLVGALRACESTTSELDNSDTLDKYHSGLSCIGEQTDMISMYYDARDLFEAVQIDDPNIVTEELQCFSFPVHIVNIALRQACFLGHSQCVQVLLEQGDADAEGRDPDMDVITPKSTDSSSSSFISSSASVGGNRKGRTLSPSSPKSAITMRRNRARTESLSHDENLAALIREVEVQPTPSTVGGDGLTPQTGLINDNSKSNSTSNEASAEEAITHDLLFRTAVSPKDVEMMFPFNNNTRPPMMGAISPRPLVPLESTGAPHPLNLSRRSSSHPQGYLVPPKPLQQTTTKKTKTRRKSAVSPVVPVRRQRSSTADGLLESTLNDDVACMSIDGGTIDSVDRFLSPDMFARVDTDSSSDSAEEMPINIPRDIMPVGRRRRTRKSSPRQEMNKMMMAFFGEELPLSPVKPPPAPIQVQVPSARNSSSSSPSSTRSNKSKPRRSSVIVSPLSNTNQSSFPSTNSDLNITHADFYDSISHDISDIEIQNYFGDEDQKDKENLEDSGFLANFHDEIDSAAMSQPPLIASPLKALQVDDTDLEPDTPPRFSPSKMMRISRTPLASSKSIKCDDIDEEEEEEEFEGADSNSTSENQDDQLKPKKRKKSLSKRTSPSSTSSSYTKTTKKKTSPIQQVKEDAIKSSDLITSPSKPITSSEKSEKSTLIELESKKTNDSSEENTIKSVPMMSLLLASDEEISETSPSPSPSHHLSSDQMLPKTFLPRNKQSPPSYMTPLCSPPRSQQATILKDTGSVPSLLPAGTSHSGTSNAPRRRISSEPSPFIKSTASSSVQESDSDEYVTAATEFATSSVASPAMSRSNSELSNGSSATDVYQHLEVEVGDLDSGFPIADMTGVENPNPLKRRRGSATTRSLPHDMDGMLKREAAQNKKMACAPLPFVDLFSAVDHRKCPEMRPLMIAAALNQPDVARVLLQNGASATVKSWVKFKSRHILVSPLHLALSLKNTAVAQVLGKRICVRCDRMLKERFSCVSCGCTFCKDCATKHRGCGIMSTPFIGKIPSTTKARDDLLKTRQWVPDEQAWCCRLCRTMFGVITRKHHCRRCGGVFCGVCSSNSVRLTPKSRKKARVCGNCAHFLNACPCYQKPARRPSIGSVDRSSTKCRHLVHDFVASSHCNCQDCNYKIYLQCAPLLASEPKTSDSNGTAFDIDSLSAQMNSRQRKHFGPPPCLASVEDTMATLANLVGLEFDDSDLV
eukprot:TRINITY_DN405_c0_g4_i1.p1 TRINITY_DN405_c0_g4~~TRINITY_DN405_c0_g4_i1.p1  ORF type:complete len:1464 (-),score=422.80 TRINITY_DN405_c0_g4_i1:523-4914(-)